MAKKVRQTPEDELKAFLETHERDTEHWNHVYHNGCGDPFWEDGTNLHLIRNHIIHSRMAIAEICDRNNLEIPQQCKRKLPPDVPSKYMARPEEIKQHAWDAVVQYESDPAYKYLLAVKDHLDNKTAEEVSITTIIGYVVGLRKSISDNDYPSMRRHENHRRYLESIHSCADKIRQRLLSRLQAEE